MIIIKYNGMTIECTDYEEAIKLIDKFAKEDDRVTIPVTPYPAWPNTQPKIGDPLWPNPWSPYITWTTDDPVKTGINEYKSNLPDDVDSTISKINSIDNYKLPDDYTVTDFGSKKPLEAEDTGKELHPLDYME